MIVIQMFVERLRGKFTTCCQLHNDETGYEDGGKAKYAKLSSKYGIKMSSAALISGVTCIYLVDYMLFYCSCVYTHLKMIVIILCLSAGQHVVLRLL